MPHLIIYIVVGLSWNTFPLGKTGMGPLGWNSFPLGNGMGLLVYYVISISPWEYRYSQQDIYLY